MSHSGLRYTPAYLFSYLQNPTKVRQHIGRARMPDYDFSEKEALALTLFLETQRNVPESWADYPPDLNRPGPTSSNKTSSSQATMLLTEVLKCDSCHSLEGRGASAATDLSEVAHRLNPEWVKKYLVAPYVFDRSGQMPSLFFVFHPKDGFVEILPESADKIGAIVDYLFSMDEERTEALQRSYQQAKATYPEVSAASGDKIFRAQNCVACHSHATITPPEKKTAPDLSIEGTRVHREWLTDYLKKPKPVRPFGFYVGSGSRMPDFRLSDEEISILSDFLMKQRSPTNDAGQDFQPKWLTAFSIGKARTLLTEKLSCLGCHRLGSQGGRIGPNLSRLSTRLQPSYVFRIIENPKALVPETIMPRPKMPKETLDLIASFLLQQDFELEDSSRLSLTDNPIIVFEDQPPPLGTYLRRCAPCHGEKGDGKGYNAQFLPKAPTAHADKLYMANRPDDTLFDGIFAGGYILNKHHFMPAFGYTLTRSEIWDLVFYIRQLCACVGPRWSRDDNQNHRQ